jgi:hypothetical protein
MVMPIDGQSRRDGNLFADFFLLRRRSRALLLTRAPN